MLSVSISAIGYKQGEGRLHDRDAAQADVGLDTRGNDPLPTPDAPEVAPGASAQLFVGGFVRRFFERMTMMSSE